VRTVVEWRYNEAGQKVKVTKKVKKVTEVTKMNKRVLDRRVRFLTFYVVKPFVFIYFVYNIAIEEVW
jgi:hypothetical protein